MLLMLPATGDAIRHGRTFAVRCARALGADDRTVGIVELLSSELVTNAVKFGGDRGAIGVRVVTHADALRLEVFDDSDVHPRLVPDRPAHLGGHGMKLVELLADDWGVRRHEGTYGKTVWLTLPLVGAGGNAALGRTG